MSEHVEEPGSDKTIMIKNDLWRSIFHEENIYSKYTLLSFQSRAHVITHDPAVESRHNRLIKVRTQAHVWA